VAILTGARQPKPVTVVGHLQDEALAVDSDVDVVMVTPCVLDNIVDGLLEDEQHLPARIGGKDKLAPEPGRLKAEVDVLSGQRVAREVAHPLQQIADAVAAD